MLDETDLSGNLTSEYVYFNGHRIARRDASGNVYYYAGDFLGSARAMVTSSGAKCYDADFYPFGGERSITNTCPQNYKFTGKERDTETGNDYFGARYYASNFGRFLSPDWSAIPAPVPYANLTNPQTLNLYAIVRDSPETFADLDGHCGQDWTTPCKNNGTSVKGKIPATGDGPANIGDGTSPSATERAQLSAQSKQAIQQAAKQYGYNAAAFENAITAAAAKSGINPNILVGLAYKESSLDPFKSNGGLFQIQPAMAKDIGIGAKSIGSFNVQIPKAAAVLARAIKTFHGNVDLGIASWTLGVAGTQRIFSSGGMQAVRGALLSRGHPKWGTVGANYIDVVKRFLGP